MKLFFFRGRVPNFGDELNTYVWPRLLANGVLDDNESELFVGIGSIIGTQLAPAARKIVMGSGYAGYMGEPDLNDGTWDIRFVRGPVTAEKFGLPPEKAVADGAILLRLLDVPQPTPNIGVAFMPHYESLPRGFWAEACGLAGIHLIDATAPVETVLAELRGASLVITEAMHGAIVSDALRIPWVATRPIFRGHHLKWQDWSGALRIDLRLHSLWPTSLLEAHVGMTGRGGAGGRAGRLSRSPIGALPNKMLTYFAAQRLRALARTEPQLSGETRISEATARAMEQVDAFVRERAES